MKLKHLLAVVMVAVLVGGASVSFAGKKCCGSEKCKAKAEKIEKCDCGKKDCAKCKAAAKGKCGSSAKSGCGKCKK